MISVLEPIISFFNAKPQKAVATREFVFDWHVEFGMEMWGNVHSERIKTKVVAKDIEQAKEKLAVFVHSKMRLVMEEGGKTPDSKNAKSIILF